MSLDAESIDVYKGAHGAVFVCDVTNLDSIRHAISLLEKAPVYIPAVLLLNKVDATEEAATGASAASSEHTYSPRAMATTEAKAAVAAAHVRRPGKKRAAQSAEVASDAGLADL